MRTITAAWPTAAFFFLGMTLPACRPADSGGSPQGPVSAVAEVPNTAAELLAAAAAWLWEQQSADGAWRSEQYAVLRSGEAYTPFVLFTLLSVPEDVCPRPADGVGRALDFIRTNARADGALGMADPELPEYPNYATAYALRCLVWAGDRQDAKLIARMKSYLIAEQYRPETGFDPQSPAYGGWGFGGVRPPDEAGHMDLAHTRRVLEALRAAGVEENDIYQRAQAFLRLVQRHPDETRPQPGADDAARVPYDGGFYFSPVVLDANKGRLEPGDDDRAGHFRSYATTTCDGLLSLLAAGVAPNDERVESARRWLADHPQLDYPAGIPHNHPDPWGDALHFYHLAVRAEVYQAVDAPGDWRASISRHVSLGRRDDGSYRNTVSPLMKEDDPLLASALAVTALACCLD